MAEKRLLLVKKEVTYGTDAAPAAADAVWAENVNYTPRGDVVRGDLAKPSYGLIPGFAYAEHGELTFDVPLAAAGVVATAPKWGVLAKMCGWAETIVAVTSVTYRPAADPQASDSGSIVFRHQKRLHKLLGARGRMTARMAEGQRPMLSFMFRGLIVPVAAALNPAPADGTFAGWLDVGPVAQGRTTFSFAGTNLSLRELSFDQSDNVVFSDRPHQESVELVGARTFTGSLKASTPPVATVNLESLFLANTQNAMTVVHGATAGSIVTLNARGQLRMPSYGEEGGFDVVTAPFDCVPSAVNVDDELALVLT